MCSTLIQLHDINQLNNITEVLPLGQVSDVNNTDGIFFSLSFVNLLMMHRLHNGGYILRLIEKLLTLSSPKINIQILRSDLHPFSLWRLEAAEY